MPSYSLSTLRSLALNVDVLSLSLRRRLPLKMGLSSMMGMEKCAAGSPAYTWSRWTGRFYSLVPYVPGNMKSTSAATSNS